MSPYSLEGILLLVLLQSPVLYIAGVCTWAWLTRKRQDQSHHEETARMYHKGWHRMGQGGRKLHTRNVSIVVYPQLKDLILAFPSQKWGGGGTGQGMRVGEGLGVPVIDLNGMTQDDLFQLGERIRKLKGK